jgi:hypothetical protein
VDFHLRPDHGLGVHAVRRITWTTKPENPPLTGTHEQAVLAACSRSGDHDRWFAHEHPMVMSGLDLRRLRRGAAPVDVDSGLLSSVESEIHAWVDAASSFVFDNPSGRHVTVQPCDLRRRYLDRGDKDAPDSLILRIARADAGRLAELCRGPRVILRRVRSSTPVERARQLDANCLRWLDRQPGESVVEKSGPKQRIRAIHRVKSSDTLENRVLKDLLMRAVEAGREYRREHQRFAKSKNVEVVQRFEATCASLLELEWIQRVPAISGIPTPNYVLQSDQRYRHVWKTWLQLVRRDRLTQSLVHWSSRWLAELALVSTLAHIGAEPHVFGTPRWSQALWLRAEPEHGEYCDPSAPVGTVEGRFGARIRAIDIARGGQLARAAWPGVWDRWVRLLPDFAVVPRDHAADTILVWGLVVWNRAQADAFESAIQELRRHLAHRNLRGIVVVHGVGVRAASCAFLEVVQLADPREIMSALGGRVGDMLCRGRAGQ